MTVVQEWQSLEYLRAVPLFRGGRVVRHSRRRRRFPRPLRLRSFEHCVRLADTGGVAEEYSQLTAPRRCSSSRTRTSRASGSGRSSVISHFSSTVLYFSGRRSLEGHLPGKGIGSVSQSTVRQHARESCFAICGWVDCSFRRTNSKLRRSSYSFQSPPRNRGARRLGRSRAEAARPDGASF